MKYACLVYVDPSIVAPLTPEQNRRLSDESFEFDADLSQRGRLVLGQPLHEPAAAVTIRVRDGRMSSTDGPFAETREHLGGFFLITADSMEEAVAIAAKSPMASMGSIEVRPAYDLVHS